MEAVGVHRRSRCLAKRAQPVRETLQSPQPPRPGQGEIAFSPEECRGQADSDEDGRWMGLPARSSWFQPHASSKRPNPGVF